MERALQNVNGRLGVSDCEIEEFERKTESVFKLVAGLKDGSIDPKDIKVPGEKTEEEIRAEAEKKKRAEKERKEKLQRKTEEERRKWWEKAEVLFNKTREEASRERHLYLQEVFGGHSQGRLSKPMSKDAGEEAVTITDDEGHVLFPRPKVKHDALDYSVWDRWVPDDPVSLQEMQKKKENIEEERNRAFEEANPEFCKQFRQDQEQRVQTQERKERKAETLKEEGNKAFKRKRYSEAAQCYEESLALSPWNVSTLGNIAQVHLRQNQVETAREYLERALFIDPDHTKSLWREARCCILENQLEQALHSLTYASLLDPGNEDVLRLLEETKEQFYEARAEKHLEQSLGSKSELGQSGPMSSSYKDVAFLQSTCLELVKGSDLSQKLAAEYMLGVFDSNEVTQEIKSRLAVLLRTSGALDVIFSRAQTQSPNRCMELAIEAVAFSAKNRAILDKERVLSSLKTRLGEQAILAFQRLVNHSMYPEHVQEYLEVLERHFASFRAKAGESNLSNACSLLGDIFRSQSHRHHLRRVTSGGCGRTGSAILRQCTELLLHDSQRVSENAAYAIANFSQDKEAADFLAAGKIVSAALRSKSSSERTRSFLLAAMLNLTIDKASPVRQELDGPCLERLLETTLDCRLARALRQRSCALLSRLLLDGASKHAKDFLSREDRDLTALLGSILCSCDQQPTDLDEDVVRCLGVCLRLRPFCEHEGTLKKLVRLLELVARSAEQGDKLVLRGASVYATNVIQCFVQVSSQSEGPLFRSRVISAVVKILQLVEDGPVRKNAAICLAKLATASDSNMQVVRSLRGMEMLVELGSRFVD